MIAEGTRFGRLVIIARAPSCPPSYRARYWCRCDCQALRNVTASRLISKKTRSCGCLSRELSSARLAARDTAPHTTHGRTYTAEYYVWQAMKRRCANPNTHNFDNYGGRGIRVCDEWCASFSAFFKHVGQRPSAKHSIDRIDNNGNYEPGNVRWATSSEQRRNQRFTTAQVKDGRALAVLELALAAL